MEKGYNVNFSLFPLSIDLFFEARRAKEKDGEGEVSFA